MWVYFSYGCYLQNKHPSGLEKQFISVLCGCDAVNILVYFRIYIGIYFQKYIEANEMLEMFLIHVVLAFKNFLTLSKIISL